MKNKEIVSEIVNDLRAMQIDDRISERYVLSKLKYFNGLFLKRENDTLRLFYYDNIWTTVECLQMEPIDVVKCLGVVIPKITSVMQSILPIPEIYSYKNGPLVKEVMPIDEGIVYQPSTIVDFNKILKREFIGDIRYYWFRNGHLVIPNGPQAAHFTACFVTQSDALQLSTCNTLTCPDPMEDEFPCPPHLVSTVKQETLKDLFNFYKRNINDEVPDSDTNNKTERPDIGNK